MLGCFLKIANVITGVNIPYSLDSDGGPDEIGALDRVKKASY